MTSLQIKKIREKHGLTQTELAERVGVTRNTIQNWESGRKIPNSKAEILCNLFGDDFVIGNNNVTRSNNHINLCPTNEEASSVIDELRTMIKDKENTIDTLKQELDAKNQQLSWFQNLIDKLHM